MSKKYTTESYKEKVKNDSKGLIEFIDEYRGYDVPSDFRCTKGHIFKLKPYRFNNGDRCKYCSGKAKPTIEEIKQFIQVNYSEYELITNEYKSRDTLLRLRHKKCGNDEVYISYNNLFFSGVTELCDLCKKKVAKYNTELYKARFDRLHKHHLELLEDYDNVEGDNIHVKCNDCGHDWYPNKYWVNRYKNPTGCPKCNSSKGENAIRNILDELDVYYEEQFSFDDLKLDRVFHFDFYVNVNNNVLLIEYDGELHFKPFSQSETSIKKFEMTQLRDSMKNEYCKKNNINLLRIKYTEFKNIKDIITNEINKL